MLACYQMKMDIIAEYDFDMIYEGGKMNVNTNAFWRNPVDPTEISKGVNCVQHAILVEKLEIYVNLEASQIVEVEDTDLEDIK